MKEQIIEEIENTLITISKHPIMIEGLEHWSDVIAEELYNAGYRKQKEGEWVEHIEKPDWLEDDVDIFYECSVCETKSPAPTNFCPNCGAKMKGGAE